LSTTALDTLFAAADPPVPPNIEDGFAAPAGMFSPTLIEKGWWH
jgi:hypothetical protein